jgi:NAD(P)-dependent dehydrogenase (short-subunit alcohol dehydrogenase family)
VEQEHNGKVALITGASSGIGEATARAFADAGYRTVLADADESGGRKLAAELEAAGHSCLFERCDVAVEKDVHDLVAQAIARFGRLDAAFNNAGIEGEIGSTIECSPANWDRVVAVNLKGVWQCMQQEIPWMIRQEGGGAIVNCASVAGLVGVPGLPAYCASKHGVVGLTRAAALEFATDHVRINAVCPGAIDTPMLTRFTSDEAAKARVTASEPIGRIGRPEEIASAVVWLCSEGASFTTGQALAVDGGWTAQ